MDEDSKKDHMSSFKNKTVALVHLNTLADGIEPFGSIAIEPQPVILSASVDPSLSIYKDFWEEEQSTNATRQALNERAGRTPPWVS